MLKNYTLALLVACTSAINLSLHKYESKREMNPMMADYLKHDFYPQVPPYGLMKPEDHAWVIPNSYWDKIAADEAAAEKAKADKA